MRSLSGVHSTEPRSRLMNISSHARSMRIGVPHIRIEDGSREDGSRIGGGTLRRESNQAGSSPGRSAAEALTAPRGESATGAARTLGVCRFAEPLAYQHFVPSCPGSRSRHVAWDPGCAFHTASALGRHSLRAGTDSPVRMAAIRTTRMISARYALHSDAADQKSHCTGREKPWSRPFHSKVNCDPGAVASGGVAVRRRAAGETVLFACLLHPGQQIVTAKANGSHATALIYPAKGHYPATLPKCLSEIAGPCGANAPEVTGPATAALRACAPEGRPPAAEEGRSC
jgi:hypothetical protein